MSERRFPDPAYLQALELELFVPHRRLPGAPPHPLYQVESPRSKSLRWIQGLQASSPTPGRERPLRRMPEPERKPAAQRVRIASLYFPDLGVFAAGSLEQGEYLSAAWQTLLKNILFACGVQTPGLEAWPGVRVSEWPPASGAGGTGEKAARAYLQGAIGYSRLREHDRRLLFGAPAGRFLASGDGRPETKISISLGEMLHQPAAKAEVWAQLQDFCQ